MYEDGLPPEKVTYSTQLITWADAKKLPYDLIFLFGGGFALAFAFEQSGLSVWIGTRLSVLEVLPPFFIVLCLSMVTVLITNLTSNTAITQILIPIVASLSRAIRINPLLLLFPTTLSASMAYMMPV